MVDICIDILGTEGTLKRHKSKHIIMYYFGFCKQLMHENSMDSGFFFFNCAEVNKKVEPVGLRVCKQ